MRGDIAAPRVVLADGAKFKGTIDMDRKPPPRRPRTNRRRSSPSARAPREERQPLGAGVAFRPRPADPPGRPPREPRVGAALRCLGPRDRARLPRGPSRGAHARTAVRRERRLPRRSRRQGPRGRVRATAPLAPRKQGEPAPFVPPFRLEQPDRAFGLVLAWEALDFVSPERLAECGAELARVLRIGGQLLCSRTRSRRRRPPSSRATGCSPTISSCARSRRPPAPQVRPREPGPRARAGRSFGAEHPAPAQPDARDRRREGGNRMKLADGSRASSCPPTFGSTPRHARWPLRVWTSSISLSASRTSPRLPRRRKREGGDRRRRHEVHRERGDARAAEGDRREAPPRQRSHLRSRRDPREPGAKSSLSCAVMALFSPGDEVLVRRPTGSRTPSRSASRARRRSSSPPANRRGSS
jgi:hypothetical protein